MFRWCNAGVGNLFSPVGHICFTKSYAGPQQFFFNFCIKIQNYTKSQMFLSNNRSLREMAESFNEMES